MKKILLFILFLLSIIACSHKNDQSAALNKVPVPDINVKHDTIYINNERDWQEGFGLTHDPKSDSVWFKPVSYYIADPNCSAIATDFYRGQFRPGDNETTQALLNLVLTDNSKLRPFYRWCLNKTIIIQDGALAEYTGQPALEYAEKYPKEFFNYMDIDSTRGKYKMWTKAIAYSGFPDKKSVSNTMKKNCVSCSPKLMNRIDTFVKDCVPESLNPSKK